jgi:hypothetical protein
MGFQVAIATALILTGRYTTLLELISFAMGVLGLFELASYFVVRRKRPALPTSRFHPWAPIAFFLISAALCIYGAKEHPWGIVTSFVILAVISLVYAAARPRAIAPEPTRDAADLPEARVQATGRRPDAET